MTEQKFLTRNLSKWLARSGLTLESLQRLHPSTQAQIGRQWKTYQSQVEGWQKNSGLSNEKLELYTALMSCDAPQFDGGIPEPPKKLLSHHEWAAAGQERIKKQMGS